MTTSKRTAIAKETSGVADGKGKAKGGKKEAPKKASPAAKATTATTAAAAAVGATALSAASKPRRGRSSGSVAKASSSPPPNASKRASPKPSSRPSSGKISSRVSAVSQTSSGGSSSDSDADADDEGDEDEGEEESDFEPELGSDSTPSGSDSGGDESEDDDGFWDDDIGKVSSDGDEKKAKGTTANAGADARPDENENNDDGDDKNNDNDSDSSEGGRPQRNTVGDVPLEWYRTEDHVGYDVDGSRIGRRSGAGRKDMLDALLERADGGEALRTIYDEREGEDIVLTRDEVRMVTNIRRGAFPHVGLSAEAGGGIDPFEDEDDYYTRHRLAAPIGNAAPEPKRRFMPSKWEERAVVKLVRALRKGWIKPRDKGASARDPESEMFGGPPRDFVMWGDDGALSGSSGVDPSSSGIAPLPAPKVPLPGHGASYNPPAEYLAIGGDEDRKEGDESDEDGTGGGADDGRGSTKQHRFFDSLRAVPAYADFVRDRFERCLDLYLCPRSKKRTPHVEDAATLLPDLPSPRDLRPFPTRLAARLRDASAAAAAPLDGEVGLPALRGVSLDPRGQWVAAAGDAGVVAFWDSRTGRLAGRVDLNKDKGAKGKGASAADPEGREASPSRVVGLSWRPGPAGSRAPLLAAAVGDSIVLLVPPEGCCTPEQRGEAEEALRSSLEAAARSKRDAPSPSPVGKWSRFSSGSTPSRDLSIDLGFRVKHLAWHPAGDYLVASTACPGGSRTVSVHRLSTGASQSPFRKLKGGTPGPVAFHPTRPALLLACGAHVRVYDLAAQALEKKLVGSSSGGGVAAIAVHPRGGEHVAVGNGGDGRLAWYDLDLSPRPFKAMRYHSRGIRSAAFHPTHPLLATAGDDGAAHVLHGAVYSDLVTPPMIVPLKVLPAHSVVRSDGALALAWHPTQPWLYTVGGDGCLCIWVDE